MCVPLLIDVLYVSMQVIHLGIIYSQNQKEPIEKPVIMR